MTIGLSLIAAAVRCFGSDYLSLAASLPDDSYYYLLPAFRFPEKGFFTFDGIHASSGFQPLWELILACSAFFIRDRETFLRAALFSTYLLRAFTALALFAAALHVRPRKHDPPNFLAGLCAAHLFLLNLPFREASTSGMENSFYACLLAFALWWLLAQHADADIRPRRVALAGLGLGCIAIARIGPTPILVMLAIGWMAIRRKPRLGRWLGLGFALPVAGWCCYGLVAFGRILPMSGSVKFHQTWEVILAGQYWNHLGAISIATFRYLLDAILFSAGWPSRFSGVAPGGLFATRWLAFMLAFALAGQLCRRKTWPLRLPTFRRASWVLLAAVLGSALVPALLWGLREELYYFHWYVAELSVLVPLLLSFAVPSVRPRIAIPAIALLGALFVTDSIAAKRSLPSLGPLKEESRAWQNVMLRAALYANDVLKLTPEDRIGAWDAGLLGYLARASVTEVDGLANDSIFRHYRAGGTLIEYLRKEKIGYFIDILEHDGWFGPRFSHFEILNRLDFEPAETPRIHGYYIGRVTDAPFPALSVSRGDDAGSAELALWTDPPVFGRAHTRNLFLQPGPRGSVQAEFVTAGKYRSLETLAGIWDGGGNAPAGACARLEIRTDGQVKSSRSGDFSAPMEVRLDLAGVGKVSIRVDGEGCATIWNSFSLADIRFLPVSR